MVNYTSKFMKSTYIIIGVVIIAGVLYFVFDRSNTQSNNQVRNSMPTEIQTTSQTTTTNTTMESNTGTTNGGVTELKKEDEVVGTGTEAKAGDTVTVQYVGMLMNGTVFDASRNHGDTGFTFTLGAGQVIKGWDLGVAGMKVGGKRKLTIPSALAYGNQSVGGGLIPANSALVFEVELVKVGK